MPERLTRNELACVRLAGEGLSDKAIARELRIPSPRTVQRHLLTSYRKLGVRDRMSAADALRRDYAELRAPVSIPIEPSPDRRVIGSPETPPTSYRPPPAGVLPTTAILLVFALIGAFALCGTAVFWAMKAW